MARPISRANSIQRALWDSYVSQHEQVNQSVISDLRSKSGRRGCFRRWHREPAIIALMPMVERIAKDVKRLFARHLDVRDLIQAGYLGLVAAANSYHPAKAGAPGFESYAYFRVRGAIIDSQKRRAYREEQNDSLQAIAAARDGWLPPRLDTDPAPLVDEQISREQIRPEITLAIARLKDPHASVFRLYANGSAPAEIALQTGASLSSTRVLIKEARQFLAHQLGSMG